MAFDFPSNPKKGDSYIEGKIEFVFDGTSWKIPDPLAAGAVTADKLLTANSGDEGEFLHRTAAGMAWSTPAATFGSISQSHSVSGEFRRGRTSTFTISGVGVSEMSRVWIFGSASARSATESAGANFAIGNGSSWVPLARAGQTRGGRRSGEAGNHELIRVGSVWWMISYVYGLSSNGGNSGRYTMGRITKTDFTGRVFTQFQLSASRRASSSASARGVWM